MKQVTLGGFLTKRPRPNLNESGEGSSQTPITNQSIPSVSNAIPQTPCSNETNDGVDLKDLPKDPADRPMITSYASNIRDDVRRANLLQGPCQIRLHKFPKKKIGDRLRSFVPSWFNDFDWLEYSVKNKKAYCLYCYVCGDLMGQKGGRDAFVSQEVLLSIRQEIGQDVFALLVDESSDVSKKEQMAIVLRYVDSLGFVKERFIGVVHVKDTSSLTLKNALNEVLTSNKLSFSQIRGQGYDGASNMRGEFNGLKALILQENDTAFYVHCFAHQLQLVVVAVAKKHDGVSDFFEQISLVVNVVCASCKRKDMLREQARQRVQKGLCSGELETGRGLNQETTLVRAGDTRWGSHFNTLTSLVKLFADVLVVLEFVKVDGGSLANRQQASGILAYFQSYEFVFYLYMMYDILHLTGTLSKQLQKKDLDILEAASMVRGTMDALQSLRDTGFATILPKVSSFCQTHNIATLEMQDFYIGARNRTTTKTNRFHFEVEIFNTVVDMQLTEYRDRFSETSTQLREYMGALSPCDSFSQFDKSKLLKLAKLYKYDFDDSDLIDLEGQLEIFYHSSIKDERFTTLKGIFELSRLMVSTGKHRSYPLVYKLLKLALILPVATASVERCISKMKLLKTDLRNKIGDEFLNDALLCYVETEALVKVDNEKVMERFQKMSARRGQI
ncbi:uncharacterized protein LOC111880587 [Lactuca sativa]|uniref:uncharacterized protein LOC111880587 n=1 Tax=Lactuca sativa TaxID=4236 RepID=UPI0022AFC97B|nr:uncharacterized protein LOC111880587 [Lactuca sativa]